MSNDKPLESVEHNGIVFEVPEGFQRVMWNEVVAGQIVFTIGRRFGMPAAYGPHIVHDVKTRKLRNPINNMTFHENLEMLIVPWESPSTKVEGLKNALFALLSGEVSLFNAYELPAVNELVIERGCGGRRIGSPVDEDDFTCDYEYEWNCEDCPIVTSQQSVQEALKSSFHRSPKKEKS